MNTMMIVPLSTPPIIAGISALCLSVVEGAVDTAVFVACDKLELCTFDPSLLIVDEVPNPLLILIAWLKVEDRPVDVVNGPEVEVLFMEVGVVLLEMLDVFELVEVISVLKNVSLAPCPAGGS